MLAIFIQSELLGGTGNCHLLLMFAGLDEIQQMTFIQVSSFGVLLNNKISLSVFRIHSINLVTEVGKNPHTYLFVLKRAWIDVGKLY